MKSRYLKDQPVRSANNQPPFNTTLTCIFVGISNIQYSFMKYCAGILLCVFFSVALQAQTILKPGFNVPEYQEMLQIFTQHYASVPDTIQKPAFTSSLPVPQTYALAYRSPQLGLKNCWDLWLRKSSRVGVISIRGTVPDGESWMQNFYAAMVPASGFLQLNDSAKFEYTLAKNPRAAVHVGWLLGMAYLAPDIVKQILTNYNKGIKEYIIIGHSQGAAIGFLLRSYLHYQTQKGVLPADIIFKTYCSAAPKPGNAYYAYDFENITHSGWGLSVVSALDWVPETPFSVQTLSDFPAVNPFSNIKGILKKRPFYIRWALKRKYNQLDRGTRKAQQNFEKNLGSLLYKQIKKSLPQLKEPGYSNSNNYQRAGQPIIFIPDERYLKKFPEKPNEIFQHHLQDNYYFLSQYYYSR